VLSKYCGSGSSYASSTLAGCGLPTAYCELGLEYASSSASAGCLFFFTTIAYCDSGTEYASSSPSLQRFGGTKRAISIGLTMNSVTALVTSHNTEKSDQQQIRERYGTLPSLSANTEKSDQQQIRER
jgi:hypothetical protein